MKVGDINENYKISQAKKLKKITTQSGDFSNLLSSDEIFSANLTSETNSISALTNINPLNSINFIDSFAPSNSRQFVIEQGKDLLQNLENLRKALILGVYEHNSLLNLEARLNNISINDEDKEIKNIIEEIKTRAAVELEKFKKNKTK
ncbi:MAG: flagellar assembly protein FliX [Rickettsiales bacterium]|nr:flagellar assembly protein FliX [Rickettsiales bacterium]